MEEGAIMPAHAAPGRGAIYSPRLERDFAWNSPSISFPLLH